MREFPLKVGQKNVTSGFFSMPPRRVAKAASLFIVTELRSKYMRVGGTARPESSSPLSPPKKKVCPDV